MPRIYWRAILAAIIIQQAINAASSSAAFVLAGRFMLTLGTPIWSLREHYSRSPLGYLLMCLAMILSFYAGGWASSFVLRRWFQVTDPLARLVHGGIFLLFYVLMYLLALGFHVPGYARQLSFGETLTWFVGAFAAIVGVYYYRHQD